MSRYDADPLQFGLPLGTLDGDPGVRPVLHVYVASKAPWFDISDDLPLAAAHFRPRTSFVQSGLCAAAERFRQGWSELRLAVTAAS